MMGIKKKIIVGFILIGTLLLMSGILSSYELAKLNSDTAEQIKDNEESLVLSKKLLDIAQQKNTALLASINTSKDVFDSVAKESDADFEKNILILKERKKSLGYIERIAAAYDRYQHALSQRGEKTDFDWFIAIYNSSYYRLTSCIKDYMVYEQDCFLKYTSVLETNMYRALMIGIIAFATGIFLLISFYFLLNLFFLSPVLRMEKSLKEFLKLKIPYSVKIETHDEINTLSSELSELCQRCEKAEEENK